MALPSSGALSLSDIQTEFGGSNPISLSEYYAGGSYVPAGCTGTNGAVPSSGTIAISNFYGTSATLGYVEDVFSTYLYTGTGATQTIINGINLSGNGGLNILKRRDGADGWYWQDSARGFGYSLASESNNVQWNPNAVTATTTGFTINTTGSSTNASGGTYSSWTFRKSAKFFDVVTYTGNGSSSQLISHSLASVPGMVICKNITTSPFINNDWRVWHRGTGTNPVNGLKLNAIDNALYPSATNASSFTSTTFDAAQVLDSGANPSNQNGAQYVAYLFAHNAGGYGLSGSDNVISCGSFTNTTGTVNLGYEPQLLLYKIIDLNGNWNIIDNMRGLTVSGASAQLNPNLASAEASGFGPSITATGFSTTVPTGTYIYIAIRRGLMKTPTDATKVFTTVTRTGNSTETKISSVGFPPDALFSMNRNNNNAFYDSFYDRLRGPKKRLSSNNTFAEYPEGETATALLSFDQAGYTVGTDDYAHINSSGTTYVNWNFRRARGFFDVICYTGSGSFSQTVTHNLGVVPEICIVKSRNTNDVWRVTISAGGSNYQGYLNTTDAFYDLSYNPSTASYFAAGDLSSSYNGTNYVGYLFASCSGVCKIGKYTGNGSSQTINCGFTGGARFVLIRRTDSTGNWFVFDSARGIVSGSDPYMKLNSTGAEDTPYGAADEIDPDSSGFIVNQSGSGININTNGANYIYLAIA